MRCAAWTSIPRCTPPRRPFRLIGEGQLLVAEGAQLDLVEERVWQPATFLEALQRLHYRYDREPLAAKLLQAFGEDSKLGSADLHTLLLMVLRNATTDSPWPIWNNPYAKYNARGRSDCNLELPLWQLVRASTAAPVYFPPEVITINGHDFVFVDGGLTMYNNPAFQMVLMATVDCYWPNAPAGTGPWPTGEDRMLVVSVGTGTSPAAHERLDPDEMNLLFNASTIPSALMFAALNEQDFLCRVFGKCLAGDPLDREVGDMLGSAGPLAKDAKLFTMCATMRS
jgi:uncharacterized protein